jgi:hypothetical protein
MIQALTQMTEAQAQVAQAQIEASQQTTGAIQQLAKALTTKKRRTPVRDASGSILYADETDIPAQEIQ